MCQSRQGAELVGFCFKLLRKIPKILLKSLGGHSRPKVAEHDETFWTEKALIT